MSTSFGKQFAELVAQTLELQELERRVQAKRLEVSRKQSELQTLVGIDARVTVPVSRALQ